MYHCKDCGYDFSEALLQLETHGFSTPPFERQWVCPACKSGNITEKIVSHCRCCGARLSDGEKEYCSPLCKERGENLRKLEIKKRKLLENSPINEILKQLKQYNEANKTNYSYGQFVVLILPKLKSEKKKCGKKKRNS